jgi:hypothetical protein
MNTNTASDPSNPKCCANGGDYVMEGMVVQQLAPGALTPVL